MSGIVEDWARTAITGGRNRGKRFMIEQMRPIQDQYNQVNSAISRSLETDLGNRGILQQLQDSNIQPYTRDIFEQDIFDALTNISQDYTPDRKFIMYTNEAGFNYYLEALNRYTKAEITPELTRMEKLKEFKIKI